MTPANITLMPMIDPAIIILMIIAGMILITIRAATPWQRAIRLIAVLMFATLLGNPQQVFEKTEPVPKTVIVVRDTTDSMSLGTRADQADAAIQTVRDQIAKNPAITPVYIDAPETANGESNLIAAIDQATGNIPTGQRGGVIMVTDGLIHDLPATVPTRDTYGPVQVLLAGMRADHDARLNLVDAPAFGLVGQTITVRVKLSLDGDMPRGPLPLNIIAGTDTVIDTTITPDVVTTLTLPVTNAGENIYLLKVPAQNGELTTVNNQIPLRVQGIRDRLKVLLVSAEPYIGGRMWRNLLTSDPGIDLVHFTILRSPTSLDPTPTSQLALIPFPFEDLFDKKLDQFDLVILDRYRANMIMPNRYLDNIAAYVKNGGGLLDVSGTAFAGADSVTKTALGDVLPNQPTGQIITNPYIPVVTALGKIHPVTSAIGAMPDPWAQWNLQVMTTSTRGDVLMTGANGAPLLTTAHADKGRVAQLGSDQIWLWSRGYKGGGPYIDLLRPLIHWLLKEPSLEEEALTSRPTTDGIVIERRTIGTDTPTLNLTAPDGQITQLPLTQTSPGLYTATFPNPKPGIYTVASGPLHHTFAAGGLNIPEWRQVVTDSKAIAKQLVSPTGGRVIRLEDHPRPTITLPKTPAAHVTGVEQKPLFPPYIWLFILGMLVIATWWVEGRTRRAEVTRS